MYPRVEAFALDYFNTEDKNVQDTLPACSVKQNIIAYKEFTCQEKYASQLERKSQKKSKLLLFSSCRAQYGRG